jgi:hypothetical protein
MSEQKPSSAELAAAAAAAAAAAGMTGIGAPFATRMAPSGASSTSALVMLHSPTHATTAMTTSSTGPASSTEPYSSSAGGSASQQDELKLSTYNPWTPQVRKSKSRVFAVAVTCVGRGQGEQEHVIESISSSSRCRQKAAMSVMLLIRVQACLQDDEKMRVTVSIFWPAL